jgi:hypothetical protein
VFTIFSDTNRLLCSTPVTLSAKPLCSLPYVIDTLLWHLRFWMLVLTSLPVMMTDLLP